MSFPKEHIVEGPVSAGWISKVEGGTAFGACASFLGIIRSDSHPAGNQHGRVEAIVYSAYREMAEGIFAGIESDIESKHGLSRCLIRHSVGRVAAGEASMLVVVLSAHRAKAFNALREAVERVKAEAPVWKKEEFSDGSHHWVGA